MASRKKESAAVPAQVFKPADLIDYQAGSVVSRTIIDKKPGIVTLFAFDKGEGLSEHTSPYDALVNVLDGHADITISGKLYKLSAGDAILMPANEPHGLRAPERFKMMLTMVKA